MSDKRVLIVDNDAGSLDELRKTLHELSPAIEVVEDSKTAMERLASEQFDLVLLEAALPAMAGGQLLDHLRQCHPHVPVVVMMDAPAVSDVVAAIRQGAVDFLKKPFQAECVRDVVQRSMLYRDDSEPASAEYDALIALAEKFLIEDQFDEVLENLKTAIVVAPGRPEAFNVLGALHEKRGDREKAVKFYRASCALDLAYHPASHNLERLTFQRSHGEKDIEVDEDPTHNL